MIVLIDGQRSAGLLSVFDEGLLRGDGCFEVIRSYAGHPFAFDLHYERLVRSTRALDLEVPVRETLRSWVDRCAADGGDCLVRVVVTRGTTSPGREQPSRCLVMWHHRPTQPQALTLAPIAAPWHPGGEAWELEGVKTISYAPNMAASRRARQEGYGDALLISWAGHVLEGPTFSVAWVADGVLETPGLDLGILDSISRRLVLGEAKRLGVPVVEGRFGIERVLESSEVLALSTVKEVTVVHLVGEVAFVPGEITTRLTQAYVELTRSGELGLENRETGRNG